MPSTAFDINSPDIIVGMARDLLALPNPNWDSICETATRVGELESLLRLHVAWIQAHGESCPIRTGSAL